MRGRGHRTATLERPTDAWPTSTLSREYGRQGRESRTVLPLGGATVCRQESDLGPQILHPEMGVALGGGDPGVAEEFLGAQSVGGEGVAQSPSPVGKPPGANFFANAC